MKKQIQVLLSILFFTGFVSAQEISYKVIASNKNCLVQKNNSQSWDKISTGSTLNRDDKIKLNEGGYLGLLNKDGNSIEIKSPGVYNINDLIKGVSEKTSHLKRFTSFIISESAVKKDKGDVMKSLGAVVRSRTGMIELFVPEFTTLITGNYEINWYPESEIKSYTIVLLDTDKKEVFNKEVTDTLFDVNVQDLNLVHGKTYFWYLKGNNADSITSDTASFSIPTETEKIAILDSLIKLYQTIDGSNGVEKLMLIKFLEALNLNKEAMIEYEALMKAFPGVEDYTLEYIKFLMNNNMPNKASVLLKTLEKM